MKVLNFNVFVCVTAGSVLIEPRRTSSEKEEENSGAMDRRMDYNKFRIIPVNSKSQDRDIPGEILLGYSSTIVRFCNFGNVC